MRKILIFSKQIPARIMEMNTWLAIRIKNIDRLTKCFDRLLTWITKKLFVRGSRFFVSCLW